MKIGEIYPPDKLMIDIRGLKSICENKGVELKPNVKVLRFGSLVIN
jgi:hypothetical protein